MTTSEILENAKRIKGSAASMSAEQKTSALINMAVAIEDDIEGILRANSADLSAVRGIMSDVMIDRLSLNEEKVRNMAENMRAIAKLPDPIGAVTDEWNDG